jgi:hypothetical protein
MSSVHRYKRGAGLLAAASLVGALVGVLPAGTAFATTVSSGYDTASSTGSLGPAAPGDAISTSQMIARAQDWIDNAVPYSEVEGWEDGATGGPYRMDCSGFVSMAWGLPNSLVTSTLPSVATLTDKDISGDTGLRTGDALDYTADHVVLFDSWISQSAGSFYYDAEHTYGQVANRTEGNIYSSTLEGYSTSVFEALRYNHIAASHSSPLSMNPTGTNTAFIDSNGSVANDWVGSNGVWAGPALEGGSARDDSPVVEDAADDHVYFIEPNGDVANDWRDSTGAWTGPALIGGTARAGSGLAVSADGKIVVFVNTSGQVVNDWGTSTGWAGPAAIGGTARADSPIVINADRDHVFFIDTSGNVVNDWSSAGGWAGPAGTGGSARAGSGLATNAAGSLVAFVNSSGQVVNDWGTSTGWQGPALMGGTARADSPIVVDANDDHAFFIDTSGNVVNDWRNSSGTWTGPAGVGGTARAGSGLAADSAGNKVAFVDTSDYVANDWGTSTGWQGPALLGGYSR